MDISSLNSVEIENNYNARIGNNEPNSDKHLKQVSAGAHYSLA